MEIDIVHLIEILVGFFVGTLTAVGALVAYLSKSDKSAFKNLKELYDTLEVRLDKTEKKLEISNKLVAEYKESQKLMQTQMVTLKQVNDSLQKENKELRADNKELNDKIFTLTQKVKLLERGTAPLPPRKG